VGLLEGERMSDKEIDDFKESLKKSIDEAKRKLNLPA
jgi:vacuolar-type H+-ATPase subunit H